MSDLTGESFKAEDVAKFYNHRPSYASQIYQCLGEQAHAKGRLLDLGCGEGKIARTMSDVFQQVVAVDPSANMIELGKSLKNGRAPNLVWVESTAEDAPIEGLFDMVTFASSIHWMDPKALFAKLRPHLQPNYWIAIVDGDAAYAPPWEKGFKAFLERWVPIASGRSFGSREWINLRDRHLDALDDIQLFDFISDPIQQTVEGFVLCQHSRNTFTLANLGDRVSEFRRELKETVDPYSDDNGLLTFRIKTRLTLAKLQTDRPYS